MALFLMVLLAWFLGDSGESEYRLLCLVTRVTMRSFVHLIRLITLSFLPSSSRYQTPTMSFLKQNCTRMTEIVDKVTPRKLNNYHKLEIFMALGLICLEYFIHVASLKHT